jgi:type II secretory pathway pseudopilin PulG
MFCIKCGKKISEKSIFCPYCGANQSTTGKKIKHKFRKSEIALIIVAIIIFLCISLTFALPDIHSAIQRSKQKQTMKDLRSIGTAVEVYQIDFNTYPICNDIDELAEFLQPNYMRMVPKLDGWRNPFLYEVRNGGEDYCLISRGRDGVQDILIPDKFDIYSFNIKLFDGFDHDIVFCDGQFTRYPGVPEKFKKWIK